MTTYFEEGEDPIYKININISTNKSISIHWRDDDAFLDRQDGPNISKYYLKSNQKHRHATVGTAIQGELFEDDFFYLS